MPVREENASTENLTGQCAQKGDPVRRAQTALPVAGLIAVLFRLADISADDALQLFLCELSGRFIAGDRGS